MPLLVGLLMSGLGCDFGVGLWVFNWCSRDDMVAVVVGGGYGRWVLSGVLGGLCGLVLGVGPQWCPQTVPPIYIMVSDGNPVVKR